MKRWVQKYWLWSLLLAGVVVLLGGAAMAEVMPPAGSGPTGPSRPQLITPIRPPLVSPIQP